MSYAIDSSATFFPIPPLSLVSKAEGGVFLFYGNPVLFDLSPLLAGWRISRGGRVLFLDGNNRFNPFPLIKLAKETRHDPKSFLSSLSSTFFPTSPSHLPSAKLSSNQKDKSQTLKSRTQSG